MITGEIIHEGLPRGSKGGILRGGSAARPGDYQAGALCGSLPSASHEFISHLLEVQ